MAEAGKRGQAVRSDCWVRFEPGGTGIRKNLKSSVAAMYSAAIDSQTEEVLGKLGVVDGLIEIEDGGALPFTITARIETAVRRAGHRPTEPALPNPSNSSFVESSRARLRRSRLYLPGNAPNFMVNAGLHEPDAIILDLEDSVHSDEKDAARCLVRNALIAVDFESAERMVRINQGPVGLVDLDWVIPFGVHVVLIPKCEHPDDVTAVDERISQLKPSAPVFLMPIIESALGCFRAYEIASASPNVVALTIGLEDYTADIGTQRTKEGRESVWARSIVVNAACAAGVQPIDTVFSDVSDMEGLAQSVTEAKSLGFVGKGCIHPRQIPVVHEAFAPTPEEIKKATRIVLAFDLAQEQGLGVVSLGSKMIDPPVVKRALATVSQAVDVGKLSKDWRDEGKSR